MKVLDMGTGKTVDVNDAYGARLIEQGKAVLPCAHKEKPPEEPAKAKKPANKGDAK